MWFKVNPVVYYGGTDGHIEEFKRMLSVDFKIKRK